MGEIDRLKRMIFDLETHPAWPWPIMITKVDSLLLPEVEQKERAMYLEALHRAFITVIERTEMEHQFSGPYGDQGHKGDPSRGISEKHVKVSGNKGVMRQRKTEKRQEAIARNAVTPPERRAAYRREHGTETD